MKEHDFELRKFQVWSATPSFSRLLLRSPMNQSEGLDENIDICFQGLKYLDIPWHFKSLKMCEVSDLSAINEKVTSRVSSDLSKVYSLFDGSEQYFVVADRVTINHNQLDIFEVSFSTPYVEGSY